MRKDKYEGFKNLRVAITEDIDKMIKSSYKTRIEYVGKVIKKMTIKDFKALEVSHEKYKSIEGKKFVTIQIKEDLFDKLKRRSESLNLKPNKVLTLILHNGGNI